MAAKPSRDKIVDTALALAENTSWEALRLHDVADELGISLVGLHSYFREKEDIVDAWFDRADQGMLEVTAKPDYRDLSPRQRLHRAFMSWFSVLAPHRRVTRQMIYGKLEPGHIHYQFAGALRVSRTVQWIREAAHRDAPLPQRALEEVALTGIFLLSFFRWMRDSSENAKDTAEFLERRLKQAERVAHVFGECRSLSGLSRGSAEQGGGVE
jgi:AcrR family transcriptional regulator